MRRRTMRLWTAACASLLIAGACDNQPAQPLGVTGQYVLVGVDGAYEWPVGGMLQVGWNTPANGYDIEISQPAALSFASFGTFAWDGRTLTLADSGGREHMTGHVIGHRLTVERGAHSFEFMKLIQMPH